MRKSYGYGIDLNYEIAVSTVDELEKFLNSNQKEIAHRLVDMLNGVSYLSRNGFVRYLEAAGIQTSILDTYIKNSNEVIEDIEDISYRFLYGDENKTGIYIELKNGSIIKEILRKGNNEDFYIDWKAK